MKDKVKVTGEVSRGEQPDDCHWDVLVMQDIKQFSFFCGSRTGKFYSPWFAHVKTEAPRY